MPRLFLGNLGHDVRTRDIEKLFKGYGEVKNVNIKGKFGFIEIEDEGDAEDAIKDLDGKSFNGGRIRIEFSNAYSGDYGGSSSSRGSSRREKSVDMDGRRFSDGRFRKSDYRVIVDNLSSRTSWQVGTTCYLYSLLNAVRENKLLKLICKTYTRFTSKGVL